jgi:hypothetical protein
MDAAEKVARPERCMRYRSNWSKVMPESMAESVVHAIELFRIRLRSYIAHAV